MKKQKSPILILFIYILAAIIYNFWVLGFWLNPSTARYGLASDLEYAGHPYNWVFIMSDVLFALTTVLAVVLLWFSQGKKLLSKYWLITVIGISLFGIMTATSAAAPMNCSNKYIRICVSIGSHTIGPDGVETTLGEISLAASLVGAFMLALKSKLNEALKWSAPIVLMLWLIISLIFINEDNSNKNLHTIQQYLLVITGLCVLDEGVILYNALPESAKSKR